LANALAAFSILTHAGYKTINRARKHIDASEQESQKKLYGNTLKTG
jgi:hypothetical protein